MPTRLPIALRKKRNALAYEREQIERRLKEPGMGVPDGTAKAFSRSS